MFSVLILKRIIFVFFFLYSHSLDPEKISLRRLLSSQTRQEINLNLKGFFDFPNVWDFTAHEIGFGQILTHGGTTWNEKLITIFDIFKSPFSNAPLTHVFRSSCRKTYLLNTLISIHSSLFSQPGILKNFYKFIKLFRWRSVNCFSFPASDEGE